MIATSPRITNYGAASATSCRWAPPLAPPLPSFICTAPSRRTTATYEDSALLEGITVGRSVSNSCGNLHLPHRFSHPRFCILNFVSRGAEAHDARSRSRSSTPADVAARVAAPPYHVFEVPHHGQRLLPSCLYFYLASLRRCTDRRWAITRHTSRA